MSRTTPGYCGGGFWLKTTPVIHLIFERGFLNLSMVVFDCFMSDPESAIDGFAMVLVLFAMTFRATFCLFTWLVSDGCE